MLENFIRVVSGLATFTDSHVRTFFYVLTTVYPRNSLVLCGALDLVEQHRPVLARELAKEILQAATA